MLKRRFALLCFVLTTMLGVTACGGGQEQQIEERVQQLEQRVEQLQERMEQDIPAGRVPPQEEQEQREQTEQDIPAGRVPPVQEEER